MSQKKVFISTADIALLAVMLAAEIILSRFLSISMPSMKIGFAFIPLAIASRRNIVGGIAVGVLGDLIGALLFPVGPYYFGFTITAAVYAIIYGICFKGSLKGKSGYIKTVIAAFLHQLIGGVLLNTVWITLLYGTAYSVIIIDRLVNAAVMIPIQILTLPPILKIVDKAIESFEKNKNGANH